MNRHHGSRPHWSTASFSSAADTSPIELAALGRHLDRCTARQGALPALRRVVEAIDEFAAPRLITTLAMIALLVVVVALMS